MTTTPQLTENAITVLNARYLLGKETPEDLFRRVANAVAEAEKPESRAYWADTFYEMMASTQFMPNSPTLFNAGTGQGTLSACFVIPVNDTMESIMQAATTSAMIQKFGGGIGYAFSKLRSRGGPISTTQGRACGAVAVLKMLSALSDMITQGGKRHGANMGILHVSHPEILNFIHMKDDNVTAQNFNISVAITDDFMAAVREGRDWDLIDPHSEQVMETLPARKIWDEIIQSAWSTGDPGLYFIDEANRNNPTPHLGNLDSTNPCGEVPLLAHEACNLGSLNLATFVDEATSTGSGRAEFNFAALEEISARAARFLDNVVTVNEFPTEEVGQAVAATRKTGLGVMGWHDALIRLGIPYDSPEALDLADEVMSRINRVARRVSIELAEERGPYPACREEVPIRNATRTCIAPTGSISAISGCSSGIEPIFAIAFVKNVLDGRRLSEVNPYFEEVARSRGFYSEEMMEAVVRAGSVQLVAEVPEDIKRLFRTAMEIDYETHVRMQATFQRHTDLAVSKTINMRHEATVADVAHAYELAYEGECSGITIYRDRSKPTQVLEVPQSAEAEGAVVEQRTKRERPAVIKGATERIRTGHGNMYITINFDEAGKPFELFTTLGKAGGCDSAQLEAISRLISLALRSGIATDQIIDELRGITCCPAWDQGVLVRSAPDAVSLVMNRHTLSETHPLNQAYVSQIGMFTGAELAQGTKQNGSHRAPSEEFTQAGPRCPDCSSTLAYEEGCLNCHTCGYTKCG